MLVLLSTATLVDAQNYAKGIRTISDDQDNNLAGQSAPASISVRIEDGKVWVNGNLVPSKELPASLKEVNPAVFYQAAIFGVKDISFQLMGHEYLVRDGKITEAPARPRMARDNSLQQQTAAEAYYSNLKREAPGLFYSLSREGALYEECRRLLIDHQLAQGKQKDKIREEIRLVIGQLFDINERNKELEIRQLEQMIEAARKEVELRKANKSLIIDKTLKDLLDE